MALPRNTRETPLGGGFTDEDVVASPSDGADGHRPVASVAEHGEHGGSSATRRAPAAGGSACAMHCRDGSRPRPRPLGGHRRASTPTGVTGSSAHHVDRSQRSAQGAARQGRSTADRVRRHPSRPRSRVVTEPREATLPRSARREQRSGGRADRQPHRRQPSEEPTPTIEAPTPQPAPDRVAVPSSCANDSARWSALGGDLGERRSAPPSTARSRSTRAPGGVHARRAARPATRRPAPRGTTVATCRSVPSERASSAP